MSLGIVEEVRRMLQTRPRLVDVLRGGTYRQVGSGAIIENVSKTAQELITTIQMKRPKIIPTVMEKIKTYEPGKLIKTLTPTGAGVGRTVTVPPPTTTTTITTTTTTTGLLRKAS